MLHLIGLGLNIKGMSLEGLEALKKCEKVYLESYTVDFPYKKEDLEKFVDKEIILAERDLVESKKIVEEAGKENVALLIYGNPLMATTHISLVEEAEKAKVGLKVIHAASVLDGISETGLQLYKFGKITSMPHFQADSYIDIVQDNQKIGAHSLILIDIGMELSGALERLNKDSRKKINLDKIVVCSKLGNENSNIFYGKVSELKKKVFKKPFCIIIPGKLHFVEEGFLNNFKKA